MVDQGVDYYRIIWIQYTVIGYIIPVVLSNYYYYRIVRDDNRNENNDDDDYRKLLAMKY